MPADSPMVLPCPFCDGLRGPPVPSSWMMGRADEMGTTADVWGHQVRCICGAGGPDRNSEAEAVAAWNQRALSASPARGEGDAPVAWRVVSPSGEEHGLFYGFDAAHANAQPGDTVKALYDHPTPATPEGEELPLGTPVEVVFSEPEVGRQVLYVAGVMIGEPGMTEPEYWLSDTWPVKSRGDITTDWKREQFTPLAALQPQAEGGSR